MFDVTQVGSWPRSKSLLGALADRRYGRIDRTDFERIADDEVRRCITHQLEAGVDIVVDGEQRRDNFYSFVTEKLDGTRLMSLSELMETVEDPSSFEEMLRTLDVPSSAIRNPTCVGPLARREPLALDELAFVREHTDKPVKITLPGPYLLTRSMWVGGLSKKAYENKTAMGDAVVGILRDELRDLAEAGCEVVQFDEPVLTEVAHSPEDARRTFM